MRTKLARKPGHLIGACELRSVLRSRNVALEAGGENCEPIQTHVGRARRLYTKYYSVSVLCTMQGWQGHDYANQPAPMFGHNATVDSSRFAPSLCKKPRR